MSRLSSVRSRIVNAARVFSTINVKSENNVIRKFTANKIMSSFRHRDFRKATHNLNSKDETCETEDKDKKENEEIFRNDSYFYIKLDGYGRASINYCRYDNIMVLLHTWVPKVAAGRGIAQRLTEHALQTAEKENLKVSVICKYIRRYIDEKAPHYKKLEVQ